MRSCCGQRKLFVYRSIYQSDYNDDVECGATGGGHGGGCGVSGGDDGPSDCGDGSSDGCGCHGDVAAVVVSTAAVFAIAVTCCYIYFSWCHSCCSRLLSF